MFHQPRYFQLGALSLAACGLLPAVAASEDTIFAQVVQLARKTAARPFEPSPELPPALAELDYDGYRNIAFEHEQAVWKQEGLPFWLEFFHRGYLFRDCVKLKLVERGEARELDYERRYFQYRGVLEGIELPADLGFAGFRVLGKFATSEHYLEIASFLGASYFRAIAEGQFYGSSARGLAIDIGLPRAEEFPVFREFWIEKPRPESRSLKIWALLESPTATGAYELLLTPGETTTCAVRAELFFRETPERVGLAPITSMWMWGDGRPAPAGDPRPRVHDSDGLLVHTGDGEWIWRPLARQPYPSLSNYDLASVRGFGLMQRRRELHNYADDEAKYHLRPSIWIEPREGWRSGAVQLLELPAEHEGIDNIAAWWSPKELPRPGEPFALEYVIHFSNNMPPQHTLAQAIAMNVERPAGEAIRLEVIFAGERLAALAAENKPEAEVSAERGEVSKIHCEKLPEGSWRLRFECRPEGTGPVESKAVLRVNQEDLSEVWRYLCPT